MDIVEELAAVRQICELKARYFRYVDTRNWDGFRACFADDAMVWFPESGMDQPASINEAFPLIRDFFVGAISGHHGHMPEIAFQANDRATGIWAMQDIVQWPPHRAVIYNQKEIKGFGHYHEDYELVEGRWYISKLKLTRLFFDCLRPTVAIS